MSDEVNVNKLRKQLGEAVEADEAYWRENDAKFRAVRQKVSSYEEFRYPLIARVWFLAPGLKS